MSNADLGPLPRLHPRHWEVEVAKRRISETILHVMQDHNLTFAETLAILADEMSGMSHRCVSIERRQEESDFDSQQTEPGSSPG